MPLRLGISACLLGEEVRWDGGHKRDAFLNDTLGPFVEWVAVCPEVDIGLGIPRETVRLVGEPEAPRLVAPKSRRDLTADMGRYARSRVREMAALDLCGFVLKKDSPSCGMERVRVYQREGARAVRKGTGMFARALLDALPLLPVEEEGRLHDPVLRENFVTRIFAYRRWRDLIASRWAMGDLVAFHTDHKLLVMAHSPTHYTALGRLVAAGKTAPRTELEREYGAGLMAALRRIATVRKNTNVLYHALGYFKRRLSDDEKREMVEIIDGYHQGLVPLIVPITLLCHYVRKYREPYLSRQVWLSPHPKELMLRNHA
ncbi:MAG: DUF523 and DUF1722 domain-containing protein [Nitrospirota bacterium]|jgi:uncharacterized protein YbgA (DUF1722 family)/uncharacterized protein YbbK (DUF523 family)